MTPANNNEDTDGDVLFNISAADATALKNVTLYWNYSGSWAANETNTSLSGTSANVLFNLTSLSDGSYNWGVYIVDEVGNTNWSSSNYTLYVNTDGTAFSSVTPANGTDINYIPLTVCYTPLTDGASITNCSLQLNSVSVQVDTSITNGAQNCFTAQDASVYEDSPLTVEIQCNDSYGATTLGGYDLWVNIYGGGGGSGGGSPSLSEQVAATVSETSEDDGPSMLQTAKEKVTSPKAKKIGKSILIGAGVIAVLCGGYILLPYLAPIGAFLIFNPIGWGILVIGGIILWKLIF